jgi:hypothetical protein
MTFCGQVAGADVRFLTGIDGWSPADELLMFFADLDPDSGAVEGGTVLMLAAAEIPAFARTDVTGALGFPAHAAMIRPVLAPPMSTDIIADNLQYDLDVSWEPWEDLYSSLGCGETTISAGHHQVFGHPWISGSLDPVWMGAIMLGSDADEAHANETHRLLFQFTTDHAAGIEISDAGSIYFVSGLSDLANKRYENVAVLSEAS